MDSYDRHVRLERDAGQDDYEHWKTAVQMRERRTAKTLGIWTLVLGWLPCCLGQVACVLLAVVTFAKSRDGCDRGKKQAVIGLAGLACWCLVGVAVVIWDPFGPDRAPDGHVTSAGDVRADDLRVGDCVAEALDKGASQTIHLVPCADPHRYQVLAIFNLPGGSYPSDDLVVRLSQRGCLKRLQHVAELRERPDLNVLFMYPLARTWRHSTSVDCLAVSRRPLTGSLLDGSSARGSEA